MVPISDIRGQEAGFSLDTHSFEALSQQQFTDVNFMAVGEIQNIFLPEVKALLLRHVPGAERVVVFDFQIRRASPVKTPARQVHKMHVDQTPEAAYQRARRHLDPEDAKDVVAGHRRFRLVNVWRPVGSGGDGAEGDPAGAAAVVVRDHPLAFADCRTLRAADLVCVRHLYNDYAGETYALRHDAAQRFYYWSDMTPSDVLLLQCFDSQERGADDGGVRHNQCAHGSFDLQEDESELYQRVSVEVRCIVLCEEQDTCVSGMRAVSLI